MIPAKTGIRKSSTFEGESIEMSIDQNSLAHIMSVLTNLYSDPEMAVLREYSSNARDSHIASGNPAPIEVNLPNTLSPFLTIQDFGLGLSLDDITAIYSRYGASTKRESNEQTGMLGLGSKSALTYASQFIMTAVKDGVKSEVLISVKTDGAGTMSVMDTASTTELNGVKITVPAKPDNKFASKAKILFSVWESGSVLIDGEPNVKVEGKEVGTDDVSIVATNLPAWSSWRAQSVDDRISAHTFVMGGVPYPAPRNIADELNRWFDCIVVFTVPMGELNFVPSREELHLTDRTEKRLAELVNIARKNARKNAYAEVGRANNKAEAFEVATQWRAIARNIEDSNKRFEFRGETVPNQFRYAYLLHQLSPSYGSRKNSRQSSIVASDLGKVLLVTGYSSESYPSATTIERVNAYVDTLALETAPTEYLFADTNFVREWVNVLAVDYSTIKAIKVHKQSVGTTTANSPTRTKDWELVTNNGGLTPADSIDFAGKQVLYFSPTELSNDEYRGYSRNRIVEHFVEDNYAVVEVAKNRQDKFVRENPLALTVQQAIRRDYAEALTAFTSREVVLYNSNNNSFGQPAKLADALEGLVDDQQFIDELRDLRDCYEKVGEVVSKFRKLARTLSFSIGESLVSDYKTSLHSYPLLNEIWLGRVTDSELVRAEFVIYLNASYALRQQSSE